MALEKVTSTCHEAQAYGTEESQAKAGYQEMGVRCPGGRHNAHGYAHVV
jgi:hypothetical protein